MNLPKRAAGHRRICLAELMRQSFGFDPVVRGGCRARLRLVPIGDFGDGVQARLSLGCPGRCHWLSDDAVSKLLTPGAATGPQFDAGDVHLYWTDRGELGVRRSILLRGSHAATSTVSSKSIAAAASRHAPVWTTPGYVRYPSVPRDGAHIVFEPNILGGNLWTAQLP